MRDNYGVEFTRKSFLQSSGNKFRINLDLTNLKSDKVIWSQTFDFVDHDIFEIQDQISTAVNSEVIPGVLSLNVASEGIKNEFTPEVYLNRLEARLAFERHTPE